MRFFLLYFWQLWKSFTLRKINVKINPIARFNKHTIFEENIVIHKGVNIMDSYIGRNTYIGPNSSLSNCQIGRFCSIASDVKVVSFTHPSSKFWSTSPSFFSILGQNGQTFVSENKYNEYLRVNGRSAIIGNDVWLGTNVLIKGGVVIGDGAIVAMGAVVTKDVPPYAIVGGVPAKIIKYRFTKEEILHLQQLKWWDKTDRWLLEHADEFDNIDNVIKIDL